MILGQTWTISFSGAMMLSIVALLGYFVGLRRVGSARDSGAKNRNEIARALSVARELESIAYRLRKSLADHVPSVVKFNARLNRLDESSAVSWREVSMRADELLKPAMRLSSEVSHAYAELTQQMTLLSTFAELRADPLTGISNRRAFDESLAKLLASHQKSGKPLAVAMLDIDHFKRINDEQGHLQGDRALQELANLLKAHTREGDFLARYGGEEFVMLMQDLNAQEACEACERLRKVVQENAKLTTSIGLALSTGSDVASELLARADAALYAAKDSGRNCVCFHEGESGRILPLRPVDTSLSALDLPAELLSDRNDALPSNQPAPVVQAAVQQPGDE